MEYIISIEYKNVDFLSFIYNFYENECACLHVGVAKKKQHRLRVGMKNIVMEKEPNQQNTTYYYTALHKIEAN